MTIRHRWVGPGKLAMKVGQKQEPDAQTYTGEWLNTAGLNDSLFPPPDVDSPGEMSWDWNMNNFSLQWETFMGHNEDLSPGLEPCLSTRNYNPCSWQHDPCQQLYCVDRVTFHKMGGRRGLVGGFSELSLNSFTLLTWKKGRTHIEFGG